MYSLRRRGLTVLEVLIALGLVATAALALLAVFTSGTRMMRQSTDLTMATDVGREFLESVKYDGYSLMAVGQFDGRVPDPSDVATLFPREPYPSEMRGDQEYELLVEVSDSSPTSRLVEVEVYWGDGKHRTKFATMVHR